MEDPAMKSLLLEYASHVQKGIGQYIPDKEPKKYLYDLIADYPNRGGKGFRPGLCIAACKAFGGTLDQVVNSAISLELMHNAFLIHDDIEDGSYYRRGRPTMHQYHNLGIAINVGDATSIIALKPLMMNSGILGHSLTLKIIVEIQQMVMETIEGQALELGWIKDNVCDMDDSDYLRMVLKKTCWYTCIHPVRIGAMIATNGKIDTARFDRFGYFMGAAFQIQDDVLNLIGEEKTYGKEIAGDLIEGKRTLMLIDLLKKCSKAEHKRIKSFLAKPRHFGDKTNVEWILKLMHKYKSIERTRAIGKYMAGAALKEFYTIFSGLPASKDKKFIEDLIIHMINRDH